MTNTASGGDMTGDRRPVLACRDCAFARISLFARVFEGVRYAKCMHPSALPDWARDDLARDELVTGVVKKPTADQFHYCLTARKYWCGPEGKFWTARQSFARLLLATAESR